MWENVMLIEKEVAKNQEQIMDKDISEDLAQDLVNEDNL